MLVGLAAALFSGAQHDGAGSLALPVAVCASGLRVQCAADTVPGALRVATPFGILHTARDAVLQISDGAAQQKRLRALRENVGSGFSAWLAETAAAGLLDELAAGCSAALAQRPETLEVYLALEHWGALLDPVPGELEVEQRLAWLWERVEKDDPVRSILYGARLAAETLGSEQADYHRRLSLATLRHGLRSPAPWVRRAAARAAGKQAELQLFETLLAASLEDPAHAAREACAWACAQIHDDGARQFWTLALARGRPAGRLAAADALGRHGAAAAVHPLAVVLSARDRVRPQRYRFAGYAVQVVSDFDPPTAASGFGRATDSLDPLDSGSAFKVTLLDDKIVIALVDALSQCRSDGPGAAAGPALWLDWYLRYASHP